MTYDFHRIKSGEIEVMLDDPSHFQILWNNDFSRAGIYTPSPSRGRGFLFAEECDYNPMPRRMIWDDEADGPYHTSAEQIFIDLATGRYTETNAYYEEGEIQGLVYAISAMQSGGELEADDYQEAIEGWVGIQAEHSPSSWQPLGNLAVSRYIHLGFMESK